MLAEDRLAEGDHRKLLVEGAAHVRTHGANAAVEAVVERALAGLLAGVRLDDEAGAREALTTVEQIRGVVGERAEPTLVEAQAHVRLGQHEEAAATYRRWLDLAPADHQKRREVLRAMRRAERGESRPEGDAPAVAGRAAGEQAQDDAVFARAKAANTAAAYLAYLSEYPEGRHVAEAKRLLEAVRAREDDAAFARAKRADSSAAYAAYLSQYPDGRHAVEARRLRETALVREGAEAEEKALNLTREKRVLVERGLASKVRSGTVDGRFNGRFRTALRSWQESRGDAGDGVSHARAGGGADGSRPGGREAQP